MRIWKKHHIHLPILLSTIKRIICIHSEHSFSSKLDQHKNNNNTTMYSMLLYTYIIIILLLLIIIFINIIIIIVNFVCVMCYGISRPYPTIKQTINKPTTTLTFYSFCLHSWYILHVTNSPGFKLSLLLFNQSRWRQTYCIYFLYLEAKDNGSGRYVS